MFKRISKLLAISFVVSGAVTLMIVGFGYKSEIITVMAQNHLLPEPENLTELYFENHNDLPKSITSGQKYEFTFTIHNLENKDMDYPYVVFLRTDEKKIILDEKSVNLKNGEFKMIKEELGSLKNSKMKITVELVNRNQQIDFWMENI